MLRGCDAWLSRCASVSDAYVVCVQSDGKLAFEQWRLLCDSRLARATGCGCIVATVGGVGCVVRAGNAYYKGEFAKYCRAQGWKVSTTNGYCKLPFVNAVRDMDDTL